MNFTKLTKEEQLTILANVAEDKGIVDNANFVVVNNVYLHKINEQKKTNESFRGRLNISNENYSMASRIIADTISVGYIKPDEAASSKKYAKYVPFWA